MYKYTLQASETIKPANVRVLLRNLVGPGELESPTSAMSRRYSNQLSYGPKFTYIFNFYGGSRQTRTADPYHVKVVL